MQEEKAAYCDIEMSVAGKAGEGNGIIGRGSGRAGASPNVQEA